ncbi:sulfate transporter 1.3-like [Phalaenopsis equestris]|uniref:sulfate transporter 1.3-like n=1 Tax=Phalaenopsis equestris TaxID=78828 RepID=UPI0009E33773|nr:sulfate transporter 1.3-like [Phalaenopsis equestris]
MASYSSCRGTDSPMEVVDIDIISSSQRRSDNSPPAYNVGLPPPRSLVSQLGEKLKETLFTDDPLRSFKNKKRTEQLVTGLQYLFPILKWGREYNLIKLKGDVVAGLTVASLCIPQAIGYASLVNLDPQYGLYSSFVPPLVYAVLGSSRDIAIGPVSVVSLLLGNLLQEEFDYRKNSAEYYRLAFTATFFAGVTEATLGWLRLGFLIDFLSHAAIIGFMGGSAITISLQQMSGLLGIKNFTKKTDIISMMKSIWGSVHHGWNWQTIAIGMSFLAFLLLAKYIGKKKRSLFWVPVITPLISIILSTFFVYITQANKNGVHIVNHIKKGINPSSAHQIYFSGSNLIKGVKIGAISGMIALTEAVAIGRTFAAMNDYQLDGNKEMVAHGTMNIVGSLTSCFIGTGSFSRSAVNDMAGCQTAASNIVMSIAVGMTLELITPLIKYTPIAIISSITINAVIGLIDYNATIHIWKVDKMDFIACMGAFFGVLFVNIEIGLLIAVLISIIKILLQVTRPRIILLGNLSGTSIYRNIQQYPEANRVPGFVIVRVDSVIYFSNSNYVKERVLRWLRDEEEKQNENGLPKIRYLIVELSSVTDIDTSGIHALEELYKSVKKRDIELIFVNPGLGLMEKLQVSKFTELIGNGRIFLTVDNAVTMCYINASEEA